MEPPKVSGSTTKKRRRVTTRDLLPRDFLKAYDLPSGGELGRGAFAIVRRCVLRAAPHEERAAKIIDMRPIRMSQNPVRMERVKREATILKQVSHPNIVRLHDVFENHETLVIVMELIRGKELFFEILEKNHMTEDDARPIFQQLCEAAAYLHDLGIVHRDIKPENILVLPEAASPNSQALHSTTASAASSPSGISTAGPALQPLGALAPAPPIIKLLDFGLSKLIDPKGGGSSAKTFVGTRAYLAPEVELLAHGQGRDYGCPADCWSMGAVLHVMLVAKFPEFDVVHKVDPEGILTPFSGVLKVEGLGLWDTLSSTCKDLIKRLMTPNAEKRMTAREALEHPWTRGLSFFPADYHPPSHRGVDFSLSARTSTTTSSAQSTSSCCTSGVHTLGSVPVPNSGNNFPPQPPPPQEQQQSGEQAAPLLFHPASCMEEDHGELRRQHEAAQAQAAAAASAAATGSNIVRHNNRQQHRAHAPAHSHQLHQEQQAGAVAPASPAGGAAAEEGAVVHQGSPAANARALHRVASDPLTQAPVELRLGLLVKIQQWIATSLGLAFHLMVSNRSRVAAEVAHCVRSGAVVCRHELKLTIKLLRKVNETAALVLAVFPDLTLALREGEMAMAQSFFLSIKNWLGEIRLEVQAVQRSNEQATAQMSRIIKKAARELVGSHKLIQYREREKRAMVERQRSEGQQGQREASADSAAKKTRVEAGPAAGAGASPPQVPAQEGQQEAEAAGAAAGAGSSEGGSEDGGEPEPPLTDEELLDSLLPSVHCEEGEAWAPIEGGAYEKKVEELAEVLNDLLPAEAVEPLRVVGEGRGSARQLEDRQMAQVVICLRRLDRILERLECFWARCELDIDTMIRRSDHVYALLTSARTPEMRARLDLRLTEYATFWSRVQVACQRYLTGVNEGTIDVMYAYLKEEALADAAGTGAGGAGAAASADQESYTVGENSTDGMEFDLPSGGEGEGDFSNDEREGGGGGAGVVAPASPLPAPAVAGHQ